MHQVFISGNGMDFAVILCVMRAVLEQLQRWMTAKHLL